VRFSRLCCSRHVRQSRLGRIAEGAADSASRSADGYELETASAARDASFEKPSKLPGDRGVGEQNQREYARSRHPPTTCDFFRPSGISPLKTYAGLSLWSWTGA
jgi:hypothetical protein